MRVRDLTGTSTWFDVADILAHADAVDADWIHAYRDRFTSIPRLTIYCGDNMLWIERGAKAPYMHVVLRTNYDAKAKVYRDVTSADIYPKSKAGLTKVLRVLLELSNRMLVAHTVGNTTCYRTSDTMHKAAAR